MRKDVVFVNAVCKAEEVKLLSQDSLLRLSAASFDDALKMLHDYGYNEGVFTRESFDIDEFICNQVNLLIAFIKEYAVSDSFQEFLLAPYLFNNVKAQFKLSIGGQKSRLYDVQINYDDETIKKALLGLSDKSLPSEIDRVLTNAMFEYKALRAKRCGGFLKNFLKAEIDTVNIMTAQRMKRMNKGGDELFIGGGNIDKFVFEKENLPKKYEDFDLSDPVKLETQCDSYLLKLAYLKGNEMDSLSPVLGFVLRKTAELKTVKMILVCIKSNARNEISHRLRGQYD